MLTHKNTRQRYGVDPFRCDGVSDTLEVNFRIVGWLMFIGNVLLASVHLATGASGTVGRVLLLACIASLLSCHVAL